MAKILAVTGSITTASRLSKELEKNGCLSSHVVHTPSSVASGGCSYAVKVPIEYMSLILNAASQTGIKLKKLYREHLEDGERIYDDIS